MTKRALGSSGESFVSFIRNGALLIVTVAWAFVGFVFWIPMLIRTTAMFSFGVLFTMLAKDPVEQTKALRKPLDYAMAFYVEGFNRILQTLQSQARFVEEKSTNPISAGLIDDSFRWQRFLGELAWTIFFWLSFIFGLAALFR